MKKINNINALYGNEEFRDLVEKRCFESKLHLKLKEEFLSLFNNWFFKHDDFVPF